MKKVTTSLLGAFLVFNISYCTAQQVKPKAKSSVNAQNNTMKNNPFFVKSKLQYEAPEFDKIKDSDFKPAFEFGLKQQEQELNAIARNRMVPTFDNTIVALEKVEKCLGELRLYFII